MTADEERMFSFSECLQYQAKSHPNNPAVIFPKGALEYGQLIRNAQAVARRLRAQGFKQGDLLTLQIQSIELQCSIIVGAMLAGVTTVSFPFRQKLPADTMIKTVFTDQKLENPGKREVVSVTPAWLEADGSGQEIPDVPRHEGIVRITYTSGTVGAPKAVPYTEEQLLRRVWIQMASLPASAGARRTMSLMGIPGGASFTYFMLTLMTGGTIFLGAEPPGAPRYLSLYGIDRILCSTAQLGQLLQVLRPKPIDVPSLRSAIVGGSYVSPQLARRAQAGLCRNLTCLYGSTEVGVVATAPAEIAEANPGAVGYVVPGVQVEVVRENGLAVGPDEEGIVRIQVPGSPSRYLNDDEASKAAFRDGWFYPGDIGRLSPEGMLFISGRQSERINAGGVKVAPNVIETVLLDWPGILDVAAFEHVNDDGVGEIAIAIVQDGELDQPALRKFCRERLRELTPQRLFLIKQIPRNDMGKVDRGMLQQLSARAFAAERRGAERKSPAQ